MLIENIEALKVWLKKTLTPICDADPNTLSQYVVALLKKNRADSDLKDFCQDQLDVFLQQKTKGFVETLFETLTSQSYLALAPAVHVPAPLPTSAPPPPPPPANVNSASTVLTPVSQNQLGNQQAIAATTDKRKKPEEVSDDASKAPLPYPRKRSGSPPRTTRRDSDRDDRRRRFDERSRFPTERRYEPPRRRSRSWSRERSPRNRSRGPRNRSRGRSRDRSRSRSPSWRRSRSRSRSITPNRSPTVRHPEIDSRGSTPVQDNGKYSTDAEAAPPMSIPSAISVVSRSTSDSRYNWNSHGRRNTPPPPRPRCKDYDEKGFCMRGDLCPFDHGLDPVIVEDISIPPVLPFPPGPPPPPPPGMPRIPPGMPRPSLPQPNLTRPPGPPGPRMTGPRPPPGPPPPRPDRPPQPYQPEGYNPEAPAINPPRSGFWAAPRGPRPSHFHQQTPAPPSSMRGRDLVQVQTLPQEPPKDSSAGSGNVQAPGFNENGQNNRTVVAPKRPYEKMLQGTGTASTEPGPPGLTPSFNKYPRPEPPKRHFDYNRLGSYRPGYNSENATLEVRKIPAEMNSIAKLNEHFGKFGTLVNIQVRHEDAPDAALITFSSNAEANSAYRSSEPVFNNRFIRLFWHKPAQPGSGPGQSSKENPSNLGNMGEDQRIPVKTRLGIPSPDKLQLNNLIPKPSQTSEKSPIYTVPGCTLTKTVYNPAALKSKSNIVSPTTAEANKKLLLEEQAKKQETLKKTLELHKQKQQLLQKYIEQQKLLLGKVEKSKNMSADDKTLLMQTIKDLSVKIDNLKGELMPKKSTSQRFKSDAQAKKEILDTELELISKQHAGDDTSDLKKKLDELTREAASMGLLARGRGRGRGSLSRGRGRGSTTWSRGGRGRGFTSGSRRLDRRPKQLKITGFPSEDKNDLLLHLAQHGEVENIDFEGDQAAVVTFKTRQDAEKVSISGSAFKGINLIMRWHTPGVHSSSLEPGGDEDEEDDDEVGGILDGLDEEALLAPDDEEEDDEESRSWRR